MAFLVLLFAVWSGYIELLIVGMLFFSPIVMCTKEMAEAAYCQITNKMRDRTFSSCTELKMVSIFLKENFSKTHTFALFSFNNLEKIQKHIFVALKIVW
jgi:hypothetical protein